MNRNLSGIYLRQLNPETGKYENVCFEDCTEDKQKEWMETRDADCIKDLAMKLGKTLKKIGDQFDICKE